MPFCPRHASPPKIIVNDICKQKAMYAAPWSAHRACQAREYTALISSTFALAIIVLAWCMSAGVRRLTTKRRSRPGWKQSSRVGFYLASLTLLIGITISTFIYAHAVRHEFYCQANPHLGQQSREWFLFAIFPGLSLLFGFTDWLYIVTYMVVGMRKDIKSPAMGVQWTAWLGLGLLTVPGSIVVAIGVLVRTIARRDPKVFFERISIIKWPFGRLREIAQKNQDNGDQPEAVHCGKNNSAKAGEVWPSGAGPGRSTGREGFRRPRSSLDGGYGQPPHLPGQPYQLKRDSEIYSIRESPPPGYHGRGEEREIDPDSYENPESPFENGRPELEHFQGQTHGPERYSQAYTNDGRAPPRHQEQRAESELGPYYRNPAPYSPAPYPH